MHQTLATSSDLRTGSCSGDIKWFYQRICLFQGYLAWYIGKIWSIIQAATISGRLASWLFAKAEEDICITVMLRRITQIIVPLKRTISKLTNNSSPPRMHLLCFIHVLRLQSWYWYIHRMPSALPGSSDFLPEHGVLTSGYDDKLSMFTRCLTFQVNSFLSSNLITWERCPIWRP